MGAQLDIHKSSLPFSDLKVGNGSVDTTAELVTGVAYVDLARGVTILADPDNAGLLYVGASNVSASNGFALKAGQQFPFEVDSSERLYIVGSEAGQLWSWVAQ